jgi:hypothetical protein
MSLIYIYTYTYKTHLLTTVKVQHCNIFTTTIHYCSDISCISPLAYKTSQNEVSSVPRRGSITTPARINQKPNMPPKLLLCYVAFLCCHGI